MTRDNQLWNILMIIGLIAGVVANADPTGLGLTPIWHNWINIIALCLAALGKFSNSPLKGVNDASK